MAFIFFFLVLSLSTEDSTIFFNHKNFCGTSIIDNLICTSFLCYCFLDKFYLPVCIIIKLAFLMHQNCSNPRSNTFVQGICSFVYLKYNGSFEQEKPDAGLWPRPRLTYYNLESYGKRAFSVAGPLLWNSLPIDIRSKKSLATFKEKLKTFLFINSFS